MLYLSGIQTEKVLTENIIDRVVDEIQKKVSEIEKGKPKQVISSN